MSFPSDEQKTVIDYLDRPLVVVAAPGTGKTRTIVARMEKLLKEDPDRDVSFITFTRSSRKDTAYKIRQSIGEKALNEAKYNFPRISTLHTYAKSILHKYASLVGYSSKFVVPIESRGELYIILQEIINDLNLDIELKSFKNEILSFRNTGKWKPNSCIKEDNRTLAVEQFKSHLRFYDSIDLQGLVILAHEILLKKPNDFPTVYLQVDEYQDLNPADQELLNLISSSNESKIVVVGDDAQSIYGFRDANPNGIKTLWESNSWEHINFKNSHRLPIHILRASQALIEDKNYLGKVNIPEDNGARILTFECTSSDIQIEKVAKEIRRIKSTNKRSDNGSLNYKDFMILCPTGTLASTVSDTLRSKYKLPTRQKEEKTIPDDHWRLLLVLRMLHNEDSLALRQWLEIIGISSDDILKYRTDASKASTNLFSYCKRLSEKPLIELFKNLSELNESIKEIELFKKRLLEFPHLNIDNSLFPEIGITINEITKEMNSIGSIIQLIHEKYGIYESENEIPDEESILVTTMHSAKGLEAEFVFILWLNKGFLPVSGRDLDEELRVFYVALTRAKQDVILTFFEKFVNNRLLKEQVMSPFLHKIYPYIDIKRIRKSDLK
jgi:DNA helicase-2/ATP-dependent DNA helicase PcrA